MHNFCKEKLFLPSFNELISSAFGRFSTVGGYTAHNCDIFNLETCSAFFNDPILSRMQMADVPLLPNSYQSQFNRV